MKKLIALILMMTSVIAYAKSFHARISDQQLMELRHAESIEKKKKQDEDSIGYQVAVTAFNNKNYNTALKIFLGRAKNGYGYASSQYQLGNMYFYGQGVVQDHLQAVYWWTQSAEQGHVEAMQSLAYSYRNGEGVSRDYAQAFNWFRKAAYRGLAYSQNMLGLMYSNGEGVVKDYAKALFWYTLAAEKGLAEAQGSLGIMHEYGDGILQDNSMAHMWYNIAASNGSKPAAKNRNDIAAKMTAQQLERAQQLARDCLAKKYKRCN